MKPRLFDVIVVILLVINLLLTAIILDNDSTSTTEFDGVYTAEISPVNGNVVATDGGETLIYADMEDLTEAITDEEIASKVVELQNHYNELSDKTELIDELELFQELLISKGYMSAAEEIPRIIEATENDDVYVIESATVIVLYEVVRQQ